MRTGARRHLLTFQKKTIPEIQDRRGAPVEDYADDFQEWGALEILGTREFPSFQKMNSETSVRFRIPYRSGIHPDKHRIVLITDYDSSPIEQSIWDIQAPTLVNGQRRELHIEARQIT